MFLLSAIIIIITYYAYKVCKFYEVPEEWKDIPIISFWKKFYRMISDPAPVDILFNNYTYPVIERLGVAVSTSIDKGQTLFITDPECLKEIMKNPDIFIKEPLTKPGQTLYQDHFGVQHVVNANGEDWSRMRKVMNSAFSQTWKPELFGECFNQAVEEWNKLEGKKILIHDQIQRMTLDILGRAFFDCDFEAVKNPESRLYQLYHGITSKIFKNFVYITFPILDKIPYLKRYELHDKVAEYNIFVDSLIKRRKVEILEGKADKDSLFTKFVQASMPSNGQEAALSTRELRDNLKIFFVAGHETTANTITAAIYYLSRYPEIQQKLRAEVVEIVGKSDKLLIPNNEQLKKMEYVNMVIKESIRSMTTAGYFERRTAKPFTFSNGIHVPTGKIVSMHLWGLFHSPKYYPEPDKFDPERFRDPNSEANKNWIPFLIGPRKCIGLNFTLMEQRVVLSMLVQAYTFKITPDNPDYEKLRLGAIDFPKAKDFHVELVRINKN